MSTIKVKIDTKEKFHVITINETHITANMTADLENSLGAYLQNGVKNVILNMEVVEEIAPGPAESIVKLQQSYYEQHASFVICCLQPAVEAFLDEQQLLEIMSSTPTESEAWDIVQMEEIERELLDDDEPSFNE